MRADIFANYPALQSVLDSLPNMYYLLDANARFVRWNRKLSELTGYSDDELQHLNALDLFRGDDHELITARIGRVFTAGYSDVQAALISKDGRATPYYFTGGRIAIEGQEYLSGLGFDLSSRIRIEEALRESEAQARALNETLVDTYGELNAIMQAGLDILYVIDMEGRLLKWNASLEKFCGLTGEQMLNRPAMDFVCEEDRPIVAAGVKKVFETGSSIIEVRFMRHDGALVPFMCNGVVLKNASGEVIGFTGSGRDMTERRQTEARLRALFDTTAIGIAVIAGDGVIEEFNTACEAMYGYSRDEVVGSNVGKLIPAPYRGDPGGRIDKHLKSGMKAFIGRTREVEAVRANGTPFTIELQMDGIDLGDRRVYIGFIKDITERKKIEHLVWQQANYDMLTQLPNRHMLHARLQQEAKKSHRSGLPMALLLIDLDRFKEVNDTMGHDMGDLLLVEAARRISVCVRETDTVARIGGDEFTVILPELTDTASIERVGHDIIAQLTEPFHLGEEKAYVSASIGIALYPKDAQDLSALFKHADQAMYVAKNAGRNRFSYYTSDLQEAAQTRLRLAADLRDALEGEQFVVYYQPIVDLSTGVISKAEALLRWRHPVRGLLGPLEFIPLAEETGLISAIGDWVLAQAVRQVIAWRGKYNPAFQISVNKSPVQIRSDEKVTWPIYLRKHGVPGQSIMVEITEGLLLNAEARVNQKLLDFRDSGIQVAIDDFGTGYSSLSYLKKFDIDYLKIDQMFVSSLETSAGDLALCEAIIVMAHKLGLKVVAEGVETSGQRDLLKAAGCDYAQGYLYSRPVPPEAFEQLLS